MIGVRRAPSSLAVYSTVYIWMTRHSEMPEHKQAGARALRAVRQRRDTRENLACTPATGEHETVCLRREDG